MLWPSLPRGDLYRGTGDFTSAMADMNEAIRLDPNFAPAYVTRGRLSYMLGNNPAALEDFTKSIKLDADGTNAYFNRGVAYYFVGGRTADAMADFKKAAGLNPKDAFAALWRDLAERRNNAPSHSGGSCETTRHDRVAGAGNPPLPGRAQRRTNFRRCIRYDPKTKLAQTCEANFYSGEFALLKKTRKRPGACSSWPPMIARKASSNRQPRWRS